VLAPFPSGNLFSSHAARPMRRPYESNSTTSFRTCLNQVLVHVPLSIGKLVPLDSHLLEHGNIKIA